MSERPPWWDLARLIPWWLSQRSRRFVQNLLAVVVIVFFLVVWLGLGAPGLNELVGQ